MELAAPALPTQHSFLERIIGAALFRAEIYDEIKRDPNATFQGAIVVLLGSAATLFWDVMDDSIWSLAIPVVLPLYLLSWVVSATLLFIFAKYLFARSQTWGMADWLLRTMGFSTAPNLFYLLAPNNVIGLLLSFGISFWVIATTIVAIRHGLQISTGRAIWVWFGTSLVLAMVGVIAAIVMIAIVMSAIA
jgi:hypothetical protein